MENFTLNHFVNEFIGKDVKFLEKDKIIVGFFSQLKQRELEESAANRLQKKYISKRSGKITEGQYQGFRFERDMWKWFLKLKPDLLNDPGHDLKLDLSGYKLDPELSKPYQKSKQTDVLFVFGDHVFVIECKSTIGKQSFTQLNSELALLRSLIGHKNKRIKYLFGERAIPVHIMSTNGYEITEEEKLDELAHSDGSVIILSEKEREYIDVVLESSESHEFALNQFLGFFRNGKNDFNKWVYNDKKDKYEKKKFKIASFRSNSGSGRKQNVFTFSIEPRDMLKISTVSHQKAKNIFEFGRSTNKYYQRLLTGKRLKEIGTHLQDKKTPFPNNILVSHRGKKLTFEIDKLNENLTNTGRVPGKLVFDGCPGTFHVIDGQHRLFGYMGVDDKPGGLRDSHRLIVTVFDELTVDEEAEIFLEVNEKSQKVASDLIMEIDWATESESKSNMCNGVIFHLRDDENSVLFDRIAPAEEKRKKGLQPWDLKPTDLKNVISKFSVIGSKEDYINGIFYESDYNTSSKKLANHLNSMLRVLEERSGFWHGKIDSRKKDMAWFTNDMLKSPKGFLQNLITKGIFLLCDRITQWCYNRNRSQSLKNLTDECIKIMEEISTGFNKLPISERKKYFDVKNKYGQGDQGIDKVGSLFLVNFLDEKKYEGLITESDRMAVNSDEAPSQEDYDEAMAKLESLNEQIQLLTSPQERAQMLEEDFGKKIHYIFAKIFGENYWFNMFFREDSLKKHVVKAEEVRKEEEKELKGDPDFKLGMHDHDIEWLQWVDWIDIIKTLVTTDYYEKKYKKEAISESLEKLFQSLFYTDSIKPIKSCNWKDGTHWMERYNVLRRKGVHRRSAKITPKQIQQLVDLEPKVQEKISIITKFVNS